jgi:hypothetical protein
MTDRHKAIGIHGTSTAIEREERRANEQTRRSEQGTTNREDRHPSDQEGMP